MFAKKAYSTVKNFPKTAYSALDEARTDVYGEKSPMWVLFAFIFVGVFVLGLILIGGIVGTKEILKPYTVQHYEGYVYNKALEVRSVGYADEIFGKYSFEIKGSNKRFFISEVDWNDTIKNGDYVYFDVTSRDFPYITVKDFRDDDAERRNHPKS